MPYTESVVETGTKAAAPAVRLPPTAFWTLDRLPAPFRMAFTARADALNLALHVGDDPRRVRENRRRVLESCGFSDQDCVVAQQVHGVQCVHVDQDDRGRGALSHSDAIAGADALVTTTRNLPLMSFSADCLLVALADPQAGVLGVAHAGWRGLAAGILEATLECMCAAGADPARIHAASSPSIGPCCFQIGADAAAALGAEHLSLRDGDVFADLREAARARLLHRGLSAQRIGIDTACTCCQEETFFSHRRATRQGLRTTGRMALIAWIE